MENPMLTFVSPTMITGDKSQVATAIHEVAHSWTGNLVTCKTWEDFWLNESLTVFIQRKITELIYGKERANVESLIENTNLKTSISNLGQISGLTKLHEDMEGKSPDMAKSAVQYEKGFQMLHELEILAGETKFQEFMQYFVQKFA
jgi:leukotriene-A4 hydrolase